MAAQSRYRRRIARRSDFVVDRLVAAPWPVAAPDTAAISRSVMSVSRSVRTGLADGPTSCGGDDAGLFGPCRFFRVSHSFAATLNRIAALTDSGECRSRLLPVSACVPFDLVRQRLRSRARSFAIAATAMHELEPPRLPSPENAHHLSRMLTHRASRPRQPGSQSPAGAVA